MFVRFFGIEMFAGRDFVSRVRKRGLYHEGDSLEVYGFGTLLVVSKEARTGD